MELISVIVPVYKVEAYLDHCVQSIVDQTYKNLEIILVDDGSPDCCPQLCDDWAKKDPRIRVIHQKNAGAGAARNAGIAIATGSVFAFVDSDDYIAPHMYEHLISLLRDDIDIAECTLFTTEKLDETFPPRNATYQLTVSSTEDALREHILDRIFCQTPVNKLYRRQAIQNTLFPVGKLIDDEFWTYKVLGNARKIAHSDMKLYAYVQQSDSAMHISYSLRRLQAVEAKSMRLQYIREHFPSLSTEAAANLWGTCLYQGQMSLKHLCKKEQQTALALLRPVAKDIRYVHVCSSLSFIYQLWFLFSKVSLSLCCKVRNFLHIGL